MIQLTPKQIETLKETLAHMEKCTNPDCLLCNAVVAERARLEKEKKDAADIALNDSKGSDPAEWPRDLRVREFPK